MLPDRAIQQHSGFAKHLTEFIAVDPASRNFSRKPSQNSCVWRTCKKFILIVLMFFWKSFYLIIYSINQSNQQPGVCCGKEQQVICISHCYDWVLGQFLLTFKSQNLIGWCYTEIIYIRHVTTLTLKNRKDNKIANLWFDTPPFTPKSFNYASFEYRNFIISPLRVTKITTVSVYLL